MPDTIIKQIEIFLDINIANCRYNENNFKIIEEDSLAVTALNGTEEFSILREDFHKYNVKVNEVGVLYGRMFIFETDDVIKSRELLKTAITRDLDIKAANIYMMKELIKYG